MSNGNIQKVTEADVEKALADVENGRGNVETANMLRAWFRRLQAENDRLRDMNDLAGEQEFGE